MKEQSRAERFMEWAEGIQEVAGGIFPTWGETLDEFPDAVLEWKADDLIILSFQMDESAVALEVD